LGTMVMSTGDAISVGVSVGGSAGISVRVAWTGRVAVVSGLPGFGVVETELPGRLQAESMATSASATDKDWMDFNFASMIVIIERVR